LTDGGALDPQKAAESPVYQHQGVRQPQEAGVHQLIGLIYPEQEAEPLSLRQGKAVADNSADGTPGELRHREKGIHGGGEALRRAEESNEQGSVAHSHTVGDGHVRIQTVQAAFLPQIIGGLPDVPPPGFQRQQRLLIPAVLLHMDAVFDEGGQHRQYSLDQQQPPHAQSIIQQCRQWHHQDLQNRVEHGRNGVCPLLLPLRQQQRVKAVVSQLVKSAETRHQQRKGQIGGVGEGVVQQEDPRSGVAYAVEQIAPYQKRFARQAVHHGGDDQRQQHHGNQLNGHRQCCGQCAARLVKDQKGQGKLTDNAAGSAKCRRGGDTGKVPRPECSFHGIHLTAMIIA